MKEEIDNGIPPDHEFIVTSSVDKSAGTELKNDMRTSLLPL